MREVERLRVADCLKPVPRQTKVKKSAYSSEGPIPVIDQGRDFIGGYTGEANAYDGELPVVVFGDHTRILKYVDFSFAVGADGTQILRPREEFLPSYFYYALKALDLKDYGYERHFKYLKQRTIPLPPKPEQQRVVTFLSAFDRLINCNRRRISLLKALPRALYTEWFENMNFPGREGVEWLESDFGLIPQKWQISKVGELVKRIPAGKKYKQKDVHPTGSVPVIDQSRRELPGYHSNKADHTASPKDPVIVFGDHTCKMELMTEPFSVAANVVPFRASGDLPTPYLFCLTQGLVNVHEYRRHWSVFRDRRVVVATDELAHKFSGIIEKNYVLMHTLRRQNQLLENCRDLLTRPLIAGEIDLGELTQPEAAVA